MKKNLLLVLFIMIFSARNLSAASHTVNVLRRSFSPENLTINQNDEVVFVFADGEHTITSSNNKWTEIVDSDPATRTLSEPFKVAGNYPYFCDFHSGMSGSITVLSTLSTTAGATTSSIKIYPNPFQDQVTIEVNSEHSIKISDYTGKVLEGLTISNGVSGAYTIDFSRTEPGFYFCNIYNKDAIVESRKIVHVK